MIILGLGSNIEDRAAYLKQAVNLLSRHITDIRLSPIYESTALLPKNAPVSWNKPYLNMALIGKTALSPEKLLKEIKKIEGIVGRKNGSPQWSPREVDIDILAYEGKVFCLDNLKVPHAHLLTRPFALLPLADIAPDWAYPVPGRYFKQSARQLAAQAVIRFPQLRLVKTDLRIPEPCNA